MYTDTIDVLMRGNRTRQSISNDGGVGGERETTERGERNRLNMTRDSRKTIACITIRILHLCYGQELVIIISDVLGRYTWLGLQRIPRIQIPIF